MSNERVNTVSTGYITGIDPGIKKYSTAVTLDIKTRRIKEIRFAPPRKRADFGTWGADFVCSIETLGRIVVVEKGIRKFASSAEATTAIVAACKTRGAEIKIHSPSKMHGAMPEIFADRGHANNKKASQRYISGLLCDEDWDLVRGAEKKYRARYFPGSKPRLHDACDAIGMVLFFMGVRPVASSADADIESARIPAEITGRTHPIKARRGSAKKKKAAKRGKQPAEIVLD